jgi:hypothetical protein
MGRVSLIGKFIVALGKFFYRLTVRFPASHSAAALNFRPRPGTRICDYHLQLTFGLAQCSYVGLVLARTRYSQDYAVLPERQVGSVLLPERWHFDVLLVKVVIDVNPRNVPRVVLYLDHLQ